MKLQTAIGATVRKIRMEQGLTLREAAGRRYISIGHWSEVETGKKGASSELLECMANALDLTTTELLKEIYTYLEEHN
jgi:transcriptional regulator with XRE-family HTH domain